MDAKTALETFDRITMAVKVPGSGYKAIEANAMRLGNDINAVRDFLIEAAKIEKQSLSDTL